MMIFIITIVFVCLAIPDIISMFKEKNYFLIWLYFSVFIITYVVSVLIGLDVKVPSTQPLIKSVITTILGSPELP